jgi:hypothetical protein
VLLVSIVRIVALQLAVGGGKINSKGSQSTDHSIHLSFLLRIDRYICDADCRRTVSTTERKPSVSCPPSQPLYFDDEKETDDKKEQSAGPSHQVKQEEKIVPSQERAPKRSKPNTYSCGCGVINDSSASECYSCGKKRGWGNAFDHLLSTNTWKCPVCSLTTNKKDKDTCAACEAWKCPACETVNEKKEITCACGVAYPGSANAPEESSTQGNDTTMNATIGAGGFTLLWK